MTAAIVVADTSVLINFLKIDRMDLLRRHPSRFLVTDHVESEIEEDEQRVRFAAAIAAGCLETCTVTDPAEVALYMRLGPGKRLGSGECSAIAVALRRHYAIAIDDNKALNRALREAGLAAAKLEIMRTPDVIVALIRAGALSIAEADYIRDIWARHHRFRIKVASFKDLL
jgi:predicted nucleic acid-binding protein